MELPARYNNSNNINIVYNFTKEYDILVQTLNIIHLIDNNGTPNGKNLLKKK